MLIRRTISRERHLPMFKRRGFAMPSERNEGMDSSAWNFHL